MHESRKEEIQIGEIINRTKDAERVASKDGVDLLYNRLAAILIHIPWYSFRTQVRLSKDSGVSQPAISRLVRGKSRPSLTVALKITQAVSERLRRRLELWEIFSLDGDYPTRSVCRLTGCRNCMPEYAFDGDGELKPEYKDTKAGEWPASVIAKRGGV